MEMARAFNSGPTPQAPTWPYDATKRHISRADCVALNQMAEEICSM